MALLFLSTIPLFAPTIFQTAHAAPNAASPNLTELSCDPADANGGRPAVNPSNCNFALQQFVATYNATPDGEIIITNDASKYGALPYIPNNFTFFPAGEPVGPLDVQCQLEIQVRPYNPDGSPVAQEAATTLTGLEVAFEDVIGNCTGSGGFGGEIFLVNDEGTYVRVAAERAS